MNKKQFNWLMTAVAITTLFLFGFAFIPPTASRHFFVRSLLILLIGFCANICYTYRGDHSPSEPLFHVHIGRSGIGLNPRHPLGYKIYFSLIFIFFSLLVASFL
ncbi:hypothetical protein [Streptococcus moroccensis]|uniref:Uncharacterized protein n=1 Tax=Streptococcus moroccensis TaxID=1451356 RepID=A0ABT9YPJ6_9STRE|nr:hypothetical protein [Streptococcus moroccensis]MDQ0221541.1 hypothetical protein [Streptococcus moroccensis]